MAELRGLDKGGGGADASVLSKDIGRVVKQLHEKPRQTGALEMDVWSREAV